MNRQINDCDKHYEACRKGAEIGANQGGPALHRRVWKDTPGDGKLKVRSEC